MRFDGFTLRIRRFAMALIVMARHVPIRVLCCREIQRSIRESVKFTLEQIIVQLG